MIVSLTPDTSELLKLYISESTFKRCPLGQPSSNAVNCGHQKGKVSQVASRIWI